MKLGEWNEAERQPSEAILNRLADAIRERDELRARLEAFEGMYLPGTRLLIPAVASRIDTARQLPGLREVLCRSGTILRISPMDAVLAPVGFDAVWPQPPYTSPER